LKPEEPVSVWQQYLDRRKIKRSERRAAAKAEKEKTKEAEACETKVDIGTVEQERGDFELLAMDTNEDRGFNARGPLRTAARRAKAKVSGDADSFKVDTEDPRIARVFSNTDFDIDPTNPEFRPSEGMTALLRKKRQRKAKSDRSTAVVPCKSSKEELPALTSQTAQVGGSTASIGEGLRLFAGQRRHSAGHGSDGTLTAEVSRDTKQASDAATKLPDQVQMRKGRKRRRRTDV